VIIPNNFFLKKKLRPSKNKILKTFFTCGLSHVRKIYHVKNVSDVANSATSKMFMTCKNPHVKKVLTWEIVQRQNFLPLFFFKFFFFRI
jgi:hypothetical protein